MRKTHGRKGQIGTKNGKKGEDYSLRLRCKKGEELERKKGRCDRCDRFASHCLVDISRRMVEPLFPIKVDNVS